MRAFYDSDTTRSSDASDPDEDWVCDFCAARFPNFAAAMVHEATHDAGAYAHDAARRIQRMFRRRRMVDGYVLV